jgi:hypothetical protein
MNIMVFNPKRESLSDFNKRVARFADTADIISVGAHEVGNKVVLALTLVDDAPQVAAFPVLCPHVVQLDPQDARLEESLDTIVSGLSEDDESTVVDTVFTPGHMVVVQCIGFFDEFGDDEGDDGGEDDDGPPSSGQEKPIEVDAERVEELSI